jgi:hypothetical protein
MGIGELYYWLCGVMNEWGASATHNLPSFTKGI